MNLSPSGVRGIGFTDQFEISWAGTNPYSGKGFCFGSEEGSLLFTDEDGDQVGPLFKASPSEEAVNGVAVVGHHLAVSTRAEITLFKPAQTKGAYRTILPIGAHGVVSGQRKTFLAPVGPMGGLVFDPDGENAAVYDIRPQTGDLALNIYRVASLPGPPKTESLICACRTQGIGATDFVIGSSEHVMRTAKFPGVDIVDVCPLRLASFPRAFVAAGRDGTLIFFRDALGDRRLQRLRAQMLMGRVYRVMVCRNHLVVLTSEAVTVLQDVVSQFAAGHELRKMAVISYSIPVKAVDASIHRDNEVLIVMANNHVAIVPLPIEIGVGSKQFQTQKNKPQEAAGDEPQWGEFAGDTRSRLALTVH